METKEGEDILQIGGLTLNIY